MTPSEAILEIIDKIKIIRADTKINEDCLKIYVEKLVLDILDYCHRKDFPSTLVFTCMDLINKRIDDEQASSSIKSIEAGDTKFEFSVNAAIASGILSDLDFDSIKPKLNLYRKIAGFSSCQCQHN